MCTFVHFRGLIHHFEGPIHHARRGTPLNPPLEMVSEMVQMGSWYLVAHRMHTMLMPNKGKSMVINRSMARSTPYR